MEPIHFSSCPSFYFQVVRYKPSPSGENVFSPLPFQGYRSSGENGWIESVTSVGHTSSQI
jgi:hypothetical protein